MTDSRALVAFGPNPVKKTQLEVLDINLNLTYDTSTIGNDGHAPT